MLDHVLAKWNKPSSKRKITILQLQQICGFLNFLAKAVIPGRAFTRHLYDKLAKHHYLKPHNHIKISEDMMLDSQMWRNFVRHPSVFCRPFLDITKTWTSVNWNFFPMPQRILVWVLELIADHPGCKNVGERILWSWIQVFSTWSYLP